MEVPIRELASAQLMVIEQVYGLTFRNRDEIAGWIGEVVYNARQILVVTSSLNNWVALEKAEGPVTLERVTFDRIVRGIRW